MKNWLRPAAHNVTDKGLLVNPLTTGKLGTAGERGSGAHDQSADHSALLVPLWSDRKLSQNTCEEYK